MNSRSYLTPPVVSEPRFIAESSYAKVRVVTYDTGMSHYDLYYRDGRTPDGMSDGWSFLCSCRDEQSACLAADLLRQTMIAAKGCVTFAKPETCLICDKEVEARPMTEPYTGRIWAYQYECCDSRVTISSNGSITSESLIYE